MSVNIVDNFLTTELTGIKKRKIIIIRLYDKNGVAVTNPVNAYKESILIRSDICSKQLSKNYGDLSNVTKSETSVYGFEINEEGLYKYFILNEDEDIDKSIIPNLIDFATNFEISLTGNADLGIYISSDLFKAIFRTYSIVNINAVGFKIEIPKMDINLESVNINGGNITLLNGGISFKADSSVDISNINITNAVDTYGKFNIAGNNITLYNITVNNPVSISTIVIKPEDILKYQTTSCTINSIKYLLSTFNDENAESTDKLFSNALLIIQDTYSAKIGDISIRGGEFYKGIKVTNCYELMMNNISRVTSRALYGYTIGLSDITKGYIDTLITQSESIPSKGVYSVFVAEKGLLFNQTLSINTFNIINTTLINLDACKADTINISNGTVNGGKFITSSELSSLHHLKLSALTVNLQDILDMYASEIKIFDSTFRLQNKEDTNQIRFSSYFKIDNSYIYSDSDLEVENTIDGSFGFSNSEIKSKTFKLFHKSDDTEKDIADNTEYYNYNKNSTISSTNVYADKGIVIDDVYKLKITNSELNSKTVNIKNINNLVFSNAVLSNSSTVELILNSVKISGSTLNRNIAISGDKFIFDNTSGELNYTLSTITGDEIINNKFNLVNSKIKIKENTRYVGISTNLKSDNSAGSVLFGTVSDISIVPNMSSKDISNFNIITDYNNIDSDKVNYGSSEDSINTESLLGIKS